MNRYCAFVVADTGYRVCVRSPQPKNVLIPHTQTLCPTVDRYPGPRRECDPPVQVHRCGRGGDSAQRAGGDQRDHIARSNFQGPRGRRTGPRRQQGITRGTSARTGDEQRIEADSVQALSAQDITALAVANPNAYLLNNAINKASTLHAAGIAGARRPGCGDRFRQSGPGFPHISPRRIRRRLRRISSAMGWDVPNFRERRARGRLSPG